MRNLYDQNLYDKKNDQQSICCGKVHHHNLDRGKMYSRKYRKQVNCVISVLSLVIAMFVVGIGSWNYRNHAETKKQLELSEQVLRFHILANSDQPKDQELKQKVREAILCYMKEELPGGMDLKETIQWSRTHKNELENVGEYVVKQAGYPYPVNAAVTTCYFPEKKIYDQTFPAGNYTALRIEIGEAKGHNWWSLLYPNLCFMEAVHVEGDPEVFWDFEDFEIKWYFQKLLKK